MQLIKFWLIVPLFVLLGASGSVYSKVQSNSAYTYVINLQSSTRSIRQTRIKDRHIRHKYRAYIVKLSNTRYPYRYRLGFFKSSKQAQKVLNKIKKDFKGAWIDKAKAGDRAALKKWIASGAGSRGSGKKIENEELKKLMASAREAIVLKKYKKAIKIYTKVLEARTNDFQQEAQEFLGVARERNGQLAHAKAEYRLYLDLYPGGDDALRVQQRLNALVTAYSKPKKGLGKFTKKSKREDWHFYGSILQFYDRDVIDTDLLGEVVANSLLSTNVLYSGTQKTDKYVMGTDFAAIHVYDFENSDTPDERITSLFLDYHDLEYNYSARVGRQRGSSSGVVGQYDGIDLSYQPSPLYKFKLLTGIPYERVKTVESTGDRHFYSAGLELGALSRHWDANFFYLEQTADGITDRQEVGAEARFRSLTSSLFTLFDYSIDFEEINYATAVYNMRLKNRTTLDVIADYRKSPFLTTTNALIGQVGVSTLGDMLDTRTEEEVKQLADDRTSDFKSFAVLSAYPVRDNFILNADFNISNFEGTIASDGVEAFEGTGNEYSLSTGFVANSFFIPYDVYIGNFRYSKLFSSDVMVLNLQSKYRLSKEWKISPRLILQLRDYDDGRDIDTIEPSVLAKYRGGRHWNFEFGLNYEAKKTRTPGTGTVSEPSYAIHMGYIYDFFY